MVLLAQNVAEAGIDAHIEAREPDGAMWSMTIGRRGETTPEAGALIETLTASGATATAYRADVASQTDMRRVLDAVATSGHPLRGVLHAAMVLDDGLLTELTDDRIRSVLVPKAGGSEVLDQLTRGAGLDFFVVYSSVAAFIGNRKQANYCAANLAMEAVVHRRRAAGDHALAVQWGLIGDAGFVVREDRVAALERSGLAMITAGTGFSVTGAPTPAPGCPPARPAAARHRTARPAAAPTPPTRRRTRCRW